jgi:hypothetical protein
MDIRGMDVGSRDKKGHPKVEASRSKRCKIHIATILP